MLKQASAVRSVLLRYQFTNSEVVFGHDHHPVFKRNEITQHIPRAAELCNLICFKMSRPAWNYMVQDYNGTSLSDLPLCCQWGAGYQAGLFWMDHWKYLTSSVAYRSFWQQRNAETKALWAEPQACLELHPPRFWLLHPSSWAPLFLLFFFLHLISPNSSPMPVWVKVLFSSPRMQPAEPWALNWNWRRACSQSSAQCTVFRDTCRCRWHPPQHIYSPVQHILSMHSFQSSLFGLNVITLLMDLAKMHEHKVIVRS